MSLTDRNTLAIHIPFQSRVQMAVTTVAEGLGQGTMTIPQGVNVTLTQCGKLAQALELQPSTYNRVFAAAVVNYPEVSAIIDTPPSNQAAETLNDAVSDAVILAAVFANYVEIAAGF